MISLILSLTPLVLITYYFLTFRKRESLSFDIKRGVRCYSCKEGVEDCDNELFSQNNLKLCKSCKRDKLLTSILVLPIKGFLTKIKKHIIGDSLTPTLKKIIVISLFLSITIDFILIIKGIKWFSFSIFTNIINIIFWTIMILEMRFTSKKKTD